MATSKRNEWLEADLEEEDNLYGSENTEESRGKSLATRSTKRQKLNDYHDDDSGSENESDEDDNSTKPVPVEPEQAEEHRISNVDSVLEPSLDPPSSTPRRRSKASVQRKLVKVNNATSRSGVVYISRVPPFMKPQTVKHLLLPYAPSGLGRIFLTPEAHDTRQLRIRGGGNKKPNFTDGWVEFVSKKEAKIVVATLNTRTIGGKKTGYYVDDVWNLKYLNGFKWGHLTEQITNENAERTSRIRAEDERERREVREFLRNVERSKVEETRKNKKKARDKKMGIGTADNEAVLVSRSDKVGLRQHKPVRAKKQSRDEQLEEVNSVLSKIF
jgi:ESF2/ABP1 family protein